MSVYPFGLPKPAVIVQIPVEAVPPIPPWWMLSLFSGIPSVGLVELETRIASDLGIRTESPLGGSLVYNSEDDCRRAAIEMMRRRPKLRVFVTSSEPDIEPYSPLAHIEIVVRLTARGACI